MSSFQILVPLLAMLAVSVQDPPPTAGGASSDASDFDARLKRIPFFQKILWTSDTSFAPFEILVQKQAVPEAGFERSVAQFYGPWLVQSARLFEETLAAPAKLEPGVDPRPIRLIVLLSEGDFLNYSKSIHTRDGLGRASFYDDRIRSVVTYWDVPGAAHAKRFPVLRRFVFALLHQRSSAFGGRQPPLWLREGISGALAWHLGPDPASAFAKPLIDASMLEELVKFSQDPARQNVFLQPLRALASVVAFDDMWKRVDAAARAASVVLGSDENWYGGYLDQSILWVHFLRREGATAHNRAFENYLRASMRGGGSTADLEKAFEGVDLTAIDREFFRWVYARWRELGKGAPDEKRLTTLFAAPLPADPATGAAAAGFALAARLDPRADDPRVAHGLALRKASRGDIEGALALLAKVVEAAQGDASLPRLRSEVDRLGAWKSARDAWIAELVASGGRLQIERDGKKLNFKVTRFEDGVLQLESAKLKEELSVGSLEPAAIAGQMKATPASSPEWVRAYAMLLCADARWERLLKDKSPQAQALRADAAGSYVELKLVGVAAEHLAALAQQADVLDGLAANTVLGRLRQMMIEVPAQPLVQERLEALQWLARAAAARLYDESHPKPEFAGHATWIDAATVELSYDFVAPGELDDWTTRAGDMQEWLRLWDPIVTPEAQRSFTVADGVWAGLGTFVFRHVLPFEAPMHMQVILRHGKAANEEATNLGQFVIGICEESVDCHIAAAEAGSLFIKDPKTGKDVYAPAVAVPAINLGQDVALELAHDGEKIRFVHAGISEPEQGVGSRRSGDVFLIVHTDREIAIESIRIRGKLGAAAVKSLRERWIASAVRKTGLP